MVDDKIIELAQSPAVMVAVTGIIALFSTLLGARIQGRHDRLVEKDRFRHEIASNAAIERLRIHTELANRVAKAYRQKVNVSSDAQKYLNEAKNFYHDHRFFFSRELGESFNHVSKSLGAEFANRELLEKNLNSFVQAVRDDLLLRELSRSVGRAVDDVDDSGAASRSSTRPADQSFGENAS